MAVAACGRPTYRATGDASATFPHPEDYSRQHPEDALIDPEPCLACHGEDEDDAAEGSSAPHCSSCHAWPFQVSSVLWRRPEAAG